MKQKAFFIIFRGLSLRQTKQSFLEGECPTLNQVLWIIYKMFNYFNTTWKLRAVVLDVPSYIPFIYIPSKWFERWTSLFFDEMFCRNKKKDYVYGQFPLKENFPWKSKWSNFIGWNWITTENFPLEETDLSTFSSPPEKIKMVIYCKGQN